MRNLLTKIKEWRRDGKTGVPELIEAEQQVLRRMMYERDVFYLLDDITIKYPSLLPCRNEIMQLLHRYQAELDQDKV